MLWVFTKYIITCGVQPLFFAFLQVTVFNTFDTCIDITIINFWYSAHLTLVLILQLLTFDIQHIWHLYWYYSY